MGEVAQLILSDTAHFFDNVTDTIHDNVLLHSKTHNPDRVHTDIHRLTETTTHNKRNEEKATLSDRCTQRPRLLMCRCDVLPFLAPLHVTLNEFFNCIRVEE
jgi:hypothetical protein